MKLTVEQIKEKFGYSHVGKFVRGIARAIKDSKWLHIREDGMPIHNQLFDYAEDFNEEEGVARVERGNETFCIRRDGTIAEEYGINGFVEG
jgi:hypothetical protein